jgi:hypothetical protein
MTSSVNVTLFATYTPLCSKDCQLLGFHGPPLCIVHISYKYTVFDCHSSEVKLVQHNYIGREKKKREERSETPKPNEAVTKFDGNLYSMRH